MAKNARNAPSEPRCIICGEAVDGLEVQEDYVIQAIRWFKRNVTRNAKNYRLVVCKNCYVKYKKSRDSYTRKQIAYVVVGVLFAGLLIAVGRTAVAVLAGVAIIALMYLLSLLSYMPAVVRKPEQQA
ncbi:hypothetical protein M1329_01485 [Candidatus Marsarchaeota archaeon]|jgi:ribosomal protein L34E|nr:hypothetical protein [Candidatus Marsarchaeota archaeon]MCL5100218.1 hypothetical protein [Candidatus Marsarchaeota archaeon]